LYTIYEGIVGVFSIVAMLGGVFWLFVGFHLMYRFYLLTEIVRKHEVAVRDAADLSSP
jgi:hypothetical protein